MAYQYSPVSLLFPKKQFRLLILILVSFLGPVVPNVLDEPFGTPVTVMLGGGLVQLDTAARPVNVRAAVM